MRLTPLFFALLIATPAVAKIAPATRDFTVGALRATAVRDAVSSRPNDGKTFGVGSPTSEVARHLAAAGLPTDTLDLSVQMLLVRSGDRVVLIDTGNGAPTGIGLASLAVAGIAPAQITDIVISHPHGDHVGGLVADGAPVYPNARVRIHADAWASMRAAPAQAGRVGVIAAKVVPLGSDGLIAPGVRAVPIPGHTPGHVGIELSSGRERLLYIADTAHHHVVSLAAPELTIAFDADEKVAEASRRALLTRAARDGSRLFAPHFPWPGLGTVRARGNGFVWLPEPRR